jgi:hypothetical protein
MASWSDRYRRRLRRSWSPPVERPKWWWQTSRLTMFHTFTAMTLV